MNQEQPQESFPYKLEASLTSLRENISLVREKIGEIDAWLEVFDKKIAEEEIEREYAVKI